MSTTMTVQLEHDIEDRLDRLAALTQQSKATLAAEAIREFVAHHEWQVNEVKAAIAEADRGDFATDDEVAALAKKWQAHAG